MKNKLEITHPVLLRQLKRLNLSADKPPTISEWNEILNRIDQSYHDADQSQYLNEISINVSSREMLQKNRDLTESINQLNKLQDQLIQSEKQATIGQISSGVAHEINNPLSYSLSNVDTLQKRIHILLRLIDLYKDILNSNRCEYGDKLISEINSFIQDNRIPSIISDFEPLFSETRDGLLRIKNIVQKLSKLSIIKKDDMLKIDINNCLKNAIEIIRNKDEFKHEININLGEVPNVYGISSELEVVFTNILMNAVESISDQGSIMVTSESTDSQVVITITDNGNGISIDNITKLFTPFFTTKPIGTNVGLGLSTAYGIIESHGGLITVISKQNGGSTFTIVLPICCYRNII